MALDNPSYFTIPGGTNSSVSNRSGRFSLLRRHVRMGTSLSPSSNSNSPAPNKTKKSERYSVLPSTNNASSAVAGGGGVAAASSEAVSSPPAPESGFRRSFRSLLRATSMDNPIQTQMLVLGMPRPSDIAPSNQHVSAHPGKKHHSRNASTGKTYKMPSSDVFGPSSRLSSKQTEPMQSFVSTESLPAEDDRYYNILSGLNFIQNGRRHSIGAYFSRKANSVPPRSEPQIQEETSFCQETERVDFKFSPETPPVATKNSANRKKCSCCRTPKGGKIGMEDIVIVSSARSQAAVLWVTYLKKCFDQIRKNRSKPPFKILGVGIEDIGAPDNLLSTVEEKLKNAKLVIYIICPVFLDYVGRNPEHTSKVCRSLRPDGVLAMLLGIGESSITDDHKKALLTYSQWKRMESVKDRDEKFVGDFLGTAMDIISKNITQQNQSSEKGSFMLMPKKVNKSQNKVLVLLNEPITKEDAMRVTVIRNNEVFEIASVKKRNPYTLIFRMPEEFLAVSMLVSVRVERNGMDLGTKLLKCESQLYALAQVLKSCDSPVEFMCQALNIVPCDKEKLDDFLVSSFQRNVPPNFNLLQTSGLGQLHRGVVCKEEYPTLLHFAARFGLEKLCWVLLECPGGELACDIRNMCELTPAEMAENAGHNKLASALCGYMQMTEFTSVYTFLKGMTDEKNNSNKSDTSDDYLNPRPLSETYQVPPSPRPLTQTYSHPPIGYMQMHSPKSNQGSSSFDSQEPGQSLGSSREKLLFRKNSEESLKKEENGQNSLKKSRDNSQDELIEIINDFKNNVFTISEVEKLVEDWKNRNDVQQSFKEKREQLNKMREEYERVQLKLKEEMKQVGRPSPLERIRNFFRGKSKESKTSDGQDCEKKFRSGENSLPHRPSSGLSIQSSSSSSSGRLSTGSHCSGTSLGDSGTHSDTESERKFRSTSNIYCTTTNRKAKESLENYDVPPNPVCLLANAPKSQTNGIFNYDIPPPSISIETGFKQQSQASSATDENGSCESFQSNEVNYYNLISKDIPIPNQSTLHGRLIPASSRNCLKSVVEGAESKTEENNCYEYINLPGLNGKVTAKCLVIGSDVVEEGEDEEEEEKDGKISNSGGVHLPDYVNVESPKIASK